MHLSPLLLSTVDGFVVGHMRAIIKKFGGRDEERNKEHN